MTKTIGLLDIHPGNEPLLTEVAGDTLNQYKTFFELNSFKVELKLYRAIKGELPKSPDECDAFLIPGSPFSVYDSETWIPPLIEFVRDCHRVQKKLVGICFGHQLIAQTLGGKVEKGIQGWELGFVTVEYSNDYSWMQSSSDKITGSFAHQDQVTQLPQGAKNFMTTDLCKHAGYTIEDHILTYQGHPEMPKASMRAVIETVKNFGSINDKEYQTSLESLKIEENAGTIIGNWIINFIQS